MCRHQIGAQTPLSGDTFEKEIGPALKKTCDHGKSFCQFDLDMTFKLLSDGTPVKHSPTLCQTS